MLDQLARRFLADLKSALPAGTEELPEKEIRSLLEGVVRKMNLVSREEFDAQQAVLQRTREKLVELQQQLNELESRKQPPPQ